MISKSLGHSRKYAQLRIAGGKLGEFCQALYPLLVANADAVGRLSGDPFTVKHAVLPTSPRKELDFAAALTAMQHCGMIDWYEAENAKGEAVQVVQIANFSAHQDLHKEAKNSQFPEFSGNARKLPESSALIKSNSIQFNSIYTEGAPAFAGTREEDIDLDPFVDPKEVAEFIRRFCELYSKHRFGARYLVVRKKHVPTVRSLLRTYPLDRLVKMATVLLTTTDDWVAGTDRGIGILSTKAAWIDGKIAEYEAEHGEIGAA